jgi:hypothetical protein
LARNNMGRLGVDETKEKNSPPSQAANPGPGFQFTAPTEFVDLPTKGKYYPEGHPLHNQETVEIRYMTAKEEDILSSATLIKNNMVIDRLLQSVLINKKIDPSYLFVGDKNALIVAARITGYGANYDTQVICPACYTSSEHSFDLNELNLYEGGDYQDFSIEESDEGTFFVDLPMSKVRVETRLLLGKDEKYLTQLAANKKKKNLLESPLTDQFKRIIVSVNGERERRVVEQFIDNMPALDSRHLRSAYAKIVPTIDMAQYFECSVCNHTTRMEVPLTSGFLWPDR